MRVEFIDRDNGPERLLCEAEIVFDEDGPLHGMRLVGFSLWKSAGSEVFVTFPARAFGTGGERKYFEFLRAMRGAEPNSVRRVKDWIVEEYQTRQAA